MTLKFAFADDEKEKVISGTKLIAIGTKGLSDVITAGNTYIAINGAENGIVPFRPYVTILSDSGKEFSCHLSRFKIKEQQ